VELTDGGAQATLEAGSPELEALAANAPFVPLEVPGYGAATVSVPIGAKRARPVMVALHGNFDRPEWQCEVWRGITSFPFILCPRGIPRGDAPKSLDRWTYGGYKATEQELLAGLDALKKRFGAHVDDGPVLYTGFSLGAILGARIMREHPERFPRAVLTEGGYESWARPAAKKYREGGGVRVLLACGQTACQQAGRGVIKTLEKEGILARVVFGGNIGHTYDGPVARSIGEAWDWLVEGDDRWVSR
jgi:pimeloyl-ACP methyl ester carboxylesterase